MATQTVTSNFGYKYSSEEEAKEANRTKAKQRYWENKEKVNQQHKERARKQREIAAFITKNPEKYQQFQNFQQIANNPQLYQNFLNYIQVLNNPQLYQQFVNFVNYMNVQSQMTVTNQQQTFELTIQPTTNR